MNGRSPGPEQRDKIGLRRQGEEAKPNKFDTLSNAGSSVYICRGPATTESNKLYPLISKQQTQTLSFISQHKLNLSQLVAPTDCGSFGALPFLRLEY
jgi:hypothetical protein